jgi:esterase/lipase superfamily enzyme
MSKMDFEPQTPIYTSDAKAWRIDQLSDVLKRLDAAGKPVVLFIHGRGKEPGKSLKGGTFTTGMAVHKIERGYGVQVIMFNWDSAFKGLNIFDREVPLNHTAAGGKALGEVLSVLQQFQLINPGANRPALLVHSMGSIVVERSIKDGNWPVGARMFSGVLFSQPDADDVGHHSWLELLCLRESVYVTQNQDDHVLLRSTDARPYGAKPLGLGTSEPLASTARYVDISNMGALGKKDADHEVFGKGAMNGQLYVCNFFTQVLTGMPVTLDPKLNVERIERGVVYFLKSKYELAAPCLKIPELPL